ncbi:prephenate dehydrogenase [Candidatus Woesearchaeota archaeon CG10_big_fil_rev_8_21_14_0_10_44_13]|nr:MAG: prephenate dehydrogenase [Candidatus Woesearchaeota archaeon CG10_big_fil_rev_8_21_14_0_10_44_13]
MKSIGIIGMGDMGKLYALIFSGLGFDVNGCDLPGKRSQLEKELAGTKIHILDDGTAVSRISDIIFYSVEAENIGKAVKLYGPSTKKGAIVAGQTSVKTPEIEAFQEYLPHNVDIITCHSLHGPSVDPKGQTLAVINHRSTPKTYNIFLETVKKLGSNIVELKDYMEHDKITADTQVTTQVGFESMGTAWKRCESYPWEDASYVGGIDNVKVLMCLRIYAGKPHVYAGLALYNPYAKEQVKQYARSVTDLFGLMIKEDEKVFRQRIEKAKEFVFSNDNSPILLDDDIMREFSLGILPEQKMPNSHLSLLAMVDAWHNLGITPYNNMICQTPLFRLRLGIAEYLFRNTELLEESAHAALFDKKIRGDDLQFAIAVNEWATLIEKGDAEGYKRHFEETKGFFKDKLPEGMKRSNELIKRLSGNR